MRSKPDFYFLHPAAPGIWQRAPVPAVPDLFPTCPKMADQSCLDRSGILAADESETQPLLAAKWTRPEHERPLRQFAAAVPDMPPVVRLSLASSCSHRVALDRNNFACLRLTSVCQTSAALLDQASRRLTGQKHRSMAGQTDAGVISADRTHGPKHARNGR